MTDGGSDSQAMRGGYAKQSLYIFSRTSRPAAYSRGVIVHPHWLRLASQRDVSLLGSQSAANVTREGGHHAHISGAVIKQAQAPRRPTHVPAAATESRSRPMPACRPHLRPRSEPAVVCECISVIGTVWGTFILTRPSLLHTPVGGCS